jgi:peptidoglycan/LPS O-acetylase OafA/YrhL
MLARLSGGQTPPPVIPEPHARNQSLDTLRGLAILLVLIGHYAHSAPYAAGGVKAGAWTQDFGQGGVLLFFLLSGYLIWTTAQKVPAPVFLLRRFAKIVPAYWVNVLFVAGAGALIPVFPAFGIKDTLGNLLFLEGSLGVTALSGVYWTLVVEVKFYLLFALVFFTPLKRLFWLVPLVAVAINIAAFGLTGRPSTLLTYLPVFFIGAGLAAMGRKALPAWAVVLIAAAALAGVAICAPYRGWQTAVFLALDIGLFLALPRLGFAEKRLAWLGVVSYSIYLYHMTLGQPLLDWLGPMSGALWPVLLAGVAALVLAVSWLSWRWVELAGVAVARRWEGKRSR